MKPYPVELRERIVKAVVERTETIEEIAIMFGVTERYVYTLMRLHRQGESLAPKAHGGGAKPKVTDKHRQTLRDAVDKQPDATLEELQALLKRRHRLLVSINTVWRTLTGMNITRKKRPVEPARPILLRVERS